jgi:hypothetical protein
MKGVETVVHVACMKEMGKKKNFRMESNVEICMGNRV